LEECEKLYDALDNNNFLKISDIIDFENCVQYINSLGNIDEIKQMKDYDLIKKAKYSNLMSKNLVINFNNFINHYDDIKEIIIDKYDSRKKINYIFKNSNFCLSSIKKVYFEGKYDIKGEEKKDKTIVKDINLSELLELKDIATLKIKSLGDAIINIKFLHLVSDISKIYNLLEEYYDYRYPKLITVRVSIKNYIQTFSITTSKDLVDISENAEKILDTLKTLNK